MYFAWILLIPAVMLHQIACSQQDDYLGQQIKFLTRRIASLQNKVNTFDGLLTDANKFCETYSKMTQQLKDDNYSEGQYNPVHNEDQVDGSKGLKLISISSDGEVDDNVNARINLIVDEDCSIQWTQLFTNGGKRSSSGTTRKVALENQLIEYSSNIILFGINSTVWTTITIHSSSHSAFLRLNMSELSNKGEYVFGNLRNKVLKYNPVVIVGPDDIVNGAINVSVTVSQSLVKELERNKDGDGNSFSLGVHYVAVDTSRDRSEVVFAGNYGFHEKILTSFRNTSEGATQLVMTIRSDYASLGGILGVTLPQETGGFENVYRQGVTIRVVNARFGSVIPFGAIATTDMRTEFYATAPSFSIPCPAFGNPTPHVSFLKVQKDGNSMEVDSDRVLLLEGAIHTRVLTFNPDQLEQSVGKYMCRVSNNNITIDRLIEVLPFREMALDETKTGIVKKNPMKIIVSCKATGLPAPIITFHRYNAYGPDILLEDRDSFSGKVQRKRFSTKATLNIFSLDPNLESVICIAQQIKKGYPLITITTVIKLV